MAKPWDDTMKRLIRANPQHFVSWILKRPVLSCLIYLRKDSKIAESPLIWELPTGQKVLYFHFIIIRLWEITTDELIQTGLAGLLPLVPLTKDGGQYEAIDEVVTKLIAAKEYNLLEYARRFASLVFKGDSDREWLNRRFAVYKDILEDSWVVQEERQEGKREGLYQPRTEHSRCCSGSICLRQDKKGD